MVRKKFVVCGKCQLHQKSYIVALTAEPTPEPPMYADLYEAYKYEDANRGHVHNFLDTLGRLHAAEIAETAGSHVLLLCFTDERDRVSPIQDKNRVALFYTAQTARHFLGTVLHFNRTVYLYRASYGWNPQNTKCMKSSYKEEEGQLVHRTIEYYGFPVRGDTYGYQVMNLWMKVIKPQQSQPYIYAAEERASVEKKMPEKPEKIKPVTSPTTLAPRSLDDDETSLSEKEYMSYVLYSDDKCVLTGAYNQTDRVSCTLWVTEAAIKNPLSHCNFILTALCGNPAYNAYKYEERICRDYDKSIRGIQRA